MDPRRLSLLRDLAAQGSVTAVARARQLTPTAVTQQLKVLQQEAGALLVRRRGRGVEITEAGRVLVRASEQIAVAMASTERQWQEYRGELSGTVTLTVFPTAGQLLLAGVLVRLANAPGIRLEVRDVDVATADYPELAYGSDVVLGHRTEGSETWDTSGCIIVPLLREPLDVALAPDHPEVGRTEVRAADVADETWISVPEGWPFDRLLTGWFGQSGLRPRISQRVTDLRIQEALVASGHGLALIPRFAADDREGHRLAMLPVAEFDAHRHIAALALPDRAERRAVRAVLRALREAARDVVLGRTAQTRPTTADREAK